MGPDWQHSIEFPGAPTCMFNPLLYLSTVSRPRTTLGTETHTHNKPVHTATEIFSFVNSLVSVPKAAELLLPRGVPHVKLNRPAVGVEGERPHLDTQGGCGGGRQNEEREGRMEGTGGGYRQWTGEGYDVREVRDITKDVSCG